ncbi:MAG TPA: N-acetylgalactosamine 6-sulfate sulfatase [Verrucomicrobiales bacterium]|jgi:arylsulfatase A-like enzyme|nr:N-acetylgalactosamine 6-sulfate sulfatase [Verrucomicrobiales bacterium]
MKRTLIFPILIFNISLAVNCFQPPIASAEDRPNVVVILTDDQGWGDLSLNGNKNLQTPNIDSLANEGVSFDRFYVCPVCSPTRAEFLSGRYHPRSGVFSTSAGGERMNLDEQTIAETFKAAGYRTGAFGKWHNGMQYPYHPNGRGFDEFYGFCSGHWGNYFSPPLEHNGQIVKGNGFLTNDLTDKAMTFMEENRRSPFFAYIPYNTPHSPMQVPDRWWNEFEDKELEMHNRDPEKENDLHLRAALAMCENIDWNVGRILQKLEELKISENTIVVYFCDNGPNGYRWNGGMKGRKGSTDEGGVRSPLLIRWPNNIAAGKQITQISAAIDLLPTLADLCNIHSIPEKPLDGISLKSLLLGKVDSQKTRMIFSHWRNRVSVRTQQFRLDHQGKLFDLSTDPGQYTNVAENYPEATDRLKTAVEKWKEKTLMGYDQQSRPFLIGHADYRFTQMPARDATTSGNIQRSNRFPNCSYFTNWSHEKETITWNAKVLTSGSYDVELYYTCPEADTGSLIQLSFNEAKLQKKLEKAHDPPLMGGENDRFKRAESYVKDFRPMKMGTIQLKKGTGTLTLKALEIPGSQAMEFRLLMLTRK